MKVKELIEELQKQNPESQVEIDERYNGREIEVKGNPNSCSSTVLIIG